MYEPQYCLIDKNFLIPDITYSSEFSYLIKKLYDKTLNASIEICKNIHVIEINDKKEIFSVYFSNGKELFYLDADGIFPFKINKCVCMSSNCVKQIEDFLEKENNNEIKTDKIKIKEIHNEINIEKVNNEIKIEDPHNEINTEKVNNEIKIEEINNETKIVEVNNFETNEMKTDEKDLFNECEKILESFANEKKRQKTLKSSILAIEKKEKELLKKKFELIQNKIIKVVGNFKTYLNIRNTFKEKEIIVPDIFKLQYEYFENELTDEEKMELSQVDDLLILNSTEFDEKLVEIANKFDDDFKVKIKPNLGFTHNWMELESDNINLH